MGLRFPAITRFIALTATCAAAPAQALELPLPPPGEDIVGQVQVVQTRYEDTFADLAEANDLGFTEIVAANPGVDAWLPGAGTDVVLPTRYILPPGPREGIVINIAEYRLYYFPKGKNVVYTYPLGIGREGWGSPIGTTTVTAKTANPAWYPPESIRAEHAADGDPLPKVVPPGPDNPLGPFKFSLGMPGYLIHGSNKKFGIGMQVSHGCFRMLNNNLLELADLAPVGTKVRIINEPYKFGMSGGHLYLEAHAPLNEDGAPTTIDRHAAVVNALLQNDEFAAANLQMDWDAVKAIVEAQDGLPVEISIAPQTVAGH
ncbi:L,D-transpeptidase family protein [Pseudomonas sp. Marseille-QA0892]